MKIREEMTAKEEFLLGLGKAVAVGLGIFSLYQGAFAWMVLFGLLYFYVGCERGKQQFLEPRVGYQGFVSAAMVFPLLSLLIRLLVFHDIVVVDGSAIGYLLIVGGLFVVTNLFPFLLGQAYYMGNEAFVSEMAVYFPAVLLFCVLPCIKFIPVSTFVSGLGKGLVYVAYSVLVFGLYFEGAEILWMLLGYFWGCVLFDLLYRQRWNREDLTYYYLESGKRVDGLGVLDRNAWKVFFGCFLLPSVLFYVVKKVYPWEYGTKTSLHNSIDTEMPIDNLK